MNESLYVGIPYGNVVGKWITYWGTESAWRGQDFKIVAQGENGNSNRIAFLAPGHSEPVWRTLGASFSAPFDKPEQNEIAQAIDDMLFNPYAEAKRTIDNEITRLTARIEELKAAKKVLDSL